jgi:hypothetical protein
VGKVEIDGRRVYWSETGGELGDAILAWEAGVGSVVVDEATPVPDTPCTFRGGPGGFAEGWRRIGRSIVFRGASDAPGCEHVEGTYRWKDGVIEVLADRQTAFQAGGMLRSCRFEDLERDRVLLLCAAPGEGNWLYSVEGDGTYRTIARPGSTISLGGTVLSAVLRNGVVAFLARDAGRRPGDADQFELYVRGGTRLAASISTETAGGAARELHYRYDGRHTALRIAPSGAVPTLSFRTDTPDTFGHVEIDLGSLGRSVREVTLGAFVDSWLPLTVTFDDGSQALHAARPDGALARILGPGDVVDGRTVLAVRLGRSTGRFVAVGIDFADGCVSCGEAWDAVYAAELEPAPVVVPLMEGARFTKLIDGDTLLPGGSSAGGLGGISLDESGTFAFARDGRVFAGIRGEIHLVAEIDEDRAGRVNRVMIDGEHVFWSKEVSDERGGGALYHWKDGISTVVADEDTPIPGTRCKFWGGADGVADSWRLVGEGVAITARSESPYPECDDEVLEGWFVWREGTLEAIPPMPPPIVIEDGGLQLECHLWSAEGERQLRWCRAPGTHQAPAFHLFEADGRHSRIVGYQDPVPGGSARIARIEGLTLRHGKVAFVAYSYDDRLWPYATRPSVYAWDGGSLHTIATPELLGLDPIFASEVEWGLLFDGRHVAVYLRQSSFDVGPLLHLARPDGSNARTIDLGVIDGHDGELYVENLYQFVGDWLPFRTSRYGEATFTVYAARADGSLFRILGPGDVVDGRLVHSANVGFTSRASTSTLALYVSFSPRPCAWCGHPTDAIYAVQLPPTDVAIDVRPGSRRNRIHPGRRELVPVALLGSADLDVADVDATSLAFGPDGTEPWRGRVARRDVNGDGLDDLVARFRQRETGIARGDGEACLAGETTDGVAFEGCDAVRTPRPRVR